MFGEFWSLRFWELAVQGANVYSVVDMAKAAHEAAVQDMMRVFKLENPADLEEKFTDPGTGAVVVREEGAEVWHVSENPTNTVPAMTGVMWPVRYGQSSGGH